MTNDTKETQKNIDDAEVNGKQEQTEKKVEAKAATEAAAEKNSDNKNSTDGTDTKKATKQSNAKPAAALAAAKSECEKLEKKLDETNTTLLRTAAEYENFRKRSTREKDMAFTGGISHAVEKLLPVIDTLTLAINAETTDESYKKGVEMTLEQCKKAFESLGVKEIDALDKPFDPNLHAAVAQQPAPEGKESGTVLAILQTGYVLGEKVVRHATVMVAE